MTEQRTENRGTRMDERFHTAPWDELDAVVFDVGNVLMRYAPEEFVRASFPGNEDKQKKMLERVFYGRYWSDLDRGTYTHEEVARLLAGEYGGSEADYLLAMTDWSEQCVLLEEGWRAVDACKARGKRVYLLSNYNGVSFRRLKERYAERFATLDGECISDAYHLLKPEPAIYRTLIEAFALTPQRTLFLDDTLANVEGAMRAGLHGFHVNEAGKMDAFFR